MKLKSIEALLKLDMRKFLLVVLSTLASLGSYAQVTGFEVEVVDVWYGNVGSTNLDGYITYRVYLTFANQTDFLSALYGLQLTNPPFEVNPDGVDMFLETDCGCYNETSFAGFLGNTAPNVCAFIPEVCADTYWTIGLTPGGNGFLQAVATASNPVVLTGADPCSTFIDDGAVFTLFGEPHGTAGADLRNLILQITTCSTEVGVNVCAQTFVNGTQENIVEECYDTFVFQNPCLANPLPTDPIVIEELLCNGQTATVDMGVGGNGPVTYELFNQGDLTPFETQVGDPVFDGLGEGNYFIAMVDEVGCRDTSVVFSFTEPPLLEASFNLTTDNDCAADAQAQVCVEVTGGVEPYDIEANSPSNTTLTPDVNGCFSSLGCNGQNGNYAFSVTDANGCIVEEQVAVACPTLLVLTTVSSAILCNGANDGGLSINVTGGTGVVTVESTIPGFVTIAQESPITSNVSDIGPGSYTITATDANGCSETSIVNFVEPTPLEVEFSANDMQCAGQCNGQVVWNASGGSGPYSLSVTNSDGATQDPNALCAGTYTATVTDANGCTASETLVVNEPEAITFELASTNVTCNGENDGEICISGAQGGTGLIQWQIASPPSESTPYGTLACFTGLTPDTYVVNFQDAAGCLVTQGGIVIMEPAELAINVTSINVSCNGFNDGSITVAATGGTGEVNLLAPDALTLPATLNDLEPGVYDLQIEDESGCVATQTVTITEPETLTVTVVSTTDISCGGDCDGSVTLDISGGTQPTTLFFNGVPSETTGICAGDYDLVVEDANGCEATASFSIIQPDPISFLINVNPVTCTGMNDGSVNIFPIGGVGQIDWEIVEDVDPNNLFEGTYSVFGEDATGCSADTTFTVTATIITDMQVTVFTSPVTCWDEADGTATAAVTGGTLPITYQWNDPNSQTTATAVGLPDDVYSVTVTDAIGCNLSFLAEVEPTIGCFFIATAITPNGDGANDDWVIGGLEYFPESIVQVYNRWGQLLFESRGYATRWDARWNNRLVPIADYYFVITYDEAREPITGTVTVKY
jgi:gliding motility-associated-like protein